MKFKNVLFLLAVSLLTFSSCKKDSEKPDLAKEVVSTYEGAFQSASGTFQSTDYKVTVSKIDNTKIKIEPEDSNGTTMEVTIAESSGTYAGSADGFAITFQEINGVMTLSYSTSATSEQFTGEKQ